MRRFSRTVVVTDQPTTIDLLQHNGTCRRAGADVALGAGLNIPAGTTSIDQALLEKARYIVVDKQALAGEVKEALDNVIASGSATVMVNFLAPSEAVPYGYLRLHTANVVNPVSIPAGTGAILFTSGFESVTESQLLAWLTALAGQNIVVGASNSQHENKRTMFGLAVGADFLVDTGSSTVSLTTQIDLFVGTKAQNVSIDDTSVVVKTESHTVKYDRTTHELIAYGDIASIVSHELACDRDVLLSTATTIDSLANQEPVSYSTDLHLERYVSLSSSSPASARISYEVSDEADLVHRTRTDIIDDQLPEWMKWRDSDSNGARIVDSFIMELSQLAGAIDESRYEPVTMPIHLMNGVANELHIGLDAYVDPTALMLTHIVQANSTEELIYAPVPAYLYSDGYLVLVRNDDRGETINLWTPMDEWGSIYGLRRHVGETLERFRDRILSRLAYERGTHTEAFISEVTNRLAPLGVDPGNTTGVEVTGLTDPSLLTDDNFPSVTLKNAVDLQTKLGAHTYDHARIGYAVWNADGPDHEGGERLPHAYDIDDQALATTSGTGPGDDLRIELESEATDVIATVAETIIVEGVPDTGVYPLTVAVAVKKTGSYTEYVTPDMVAIVRVQLTHPTLGMVWRDLEIEGSSNKSVADDRATNSNIYQEMLVDPDTGQLTGVWTSLDANSNEITVTPDQLAVIWDAENLGPEHAERAGLFMTAAVTSIKRSDNGLVINDGAFIRLNEEMAFTSTIILNSDSPELDLIGIAAVDLAFKDDLGTANISWSSDVSSYTLHRNHIVDSATGNFTVSADTVKTNPIPVPPYITNATLSATIVSITADLNRTHDIAETALTASVDGNGVLSTNVVDASELTYPVKTFSANTNTRTITFKALAPGESRSMESPFVTTEGYLYSVASSDPLVTMTIKDSQVTAVRAARGIVCVKPGWYWHAGTQRYFYVGAKTGDIAGTVGTISIDISPDSKIAVYDKATGSETHSHRYAFDENYNKTFNVKINVTFNGGDVLVLPDKDISNVVIRKDGRVLTTNNVDNEVVINDDVEAGDVLEASYVLKNSFYVNWIPGQLVISPRDGGDTRQLAWKAQPADQVLNTGLTISPHENPFDKYFIALEETEDLVGPVKMTVSTSSSTVEVGQPFLVNVTSSYADGSAAPNEPYTVAVTGGVLAGATNRTTGDLGNGLIEIWPTDAVTVTVTHNGTPTVKTFAKNTANNGAAWTGRTVVFDAPTAIRLGSATTIAGRAWTSSGVPAANLNCTWSLKRYALDESGDGEGTDYVSVVASTAFTTDANGNFSIALTAAQLASRGAYQLTTTINGTTDVAVWRIY
jgi:hypothetical protein